jgi:hypothetical protein
MRSATQRQQGKKQQWRAIYAEGEAREQAAGRGGEQEGIESRQAEADGEGKEAGAREVKVEAVIATAENTAQADAGQEGRDNRHEARAEVTETLLARTISTCTFSTECSHQPMTTCVTLDHHHRRRRWTSLVLQACYRAPLSSRGCGRRERGADRGTSVVLQVCYRGGARKAVSAQAEAMSAVLSKVSAVLFAWGSGVMPW